MTAITYRLSTLPAVSHLVNWSPASPPSAPIGRLPVRVDSERIPVDAVASARPPGIASIRKKSGQAMASGRAAHVRRGNDSMLPSISGVVSRHPLATFFVLAYAFAWWPVLPFDGKLLPH